MSRIGHSFLSILTLCLGFSTQFANGAPIADAYDLKPSLAKRRAPSEDSFHSKKVKIEHAPVQNLFTKKQKQGLAQLPENVQAKVLTLAQESYDLKNDRSKVSNAWNISTIEPGVPSTPTKALQGKRVVIPTPIARKTLSRFEVAHLIEWDLARPRELMASHKQEAETKIKNYENYIFQMQCNLENEIKDMEEMGGKSRAQYQQHLQESRTHLTTHIVSEFAKFIEEATRLHGHGESLRIAMHRKFYTDLTHKLFHVPIKAEGIELNFYVNPADIDFDLTDKQGRTNRNRMLEGLNPVAPNDKGVLVSFDYHHITQSQENFAPILCLPPHLHTEALHPFNGYGNHMDAVDRSYFNTIKRLVNKFIAQNL